MFAHIRHFIAATILFNQKIAGQAGLHFTDMQCVNLLDLLGPVKPGKLAQRINQQFEAFLWETPDDELQAVVNFFSRMSSLRRESGEE